MCVSFASLISLVFRHNPMNPTFSGPNIFTTYGAASAIGLPVFVSMTFDTTHCHFASRIR